MGLGEFALLAKGEDRGVGGRLGPACGFDAVGGGFEGGGLGGSEGGKTGLLRLIAGGGERACFGFAGLVLCGFVDLFRPGLLPHLLEPVPRFGQ